MSPLVLAEIVVKDLIQVVWVSAAAGVGVTLVFSVAIFGSTRFGELRREERYPEALVAGLIGVVSLVAVLLTMAAGIYGLTR